LFLFIHSNVIKVCLINFLKQFTSLLVLDSPHTYQLTN